jgi:hypothetical protein
LIERIDKSGSRGKRMIIVIWRKLKDVENDDASGNSDKEEIPQERKIIFV